MSHKLKVYCVLWRDSSWDGDILEHIFALEQEAEEKAEELNKKEKCDSYLVEEWEVE